MSCLAWGPLQGEPARQERFPQQPSSPHIPLHAPTLSENHRFSMPGYCQHRSSLRFMFLKQSCMVELTPANEIHTEICEFEPSQVVLKRLPGTLTHQKQQACSSLQAARAWQVVTNQLSTRFDWAQWPHDQSSVGGRTTLAYSICNCLGQRHNCTQHPTIIKSLSYLEQGLRLCWRRGGCYACLEQTGVRRRLPVARTSNIGVFPMACPQAVLWLQGEQGDHSRRGACQHGGPHPTPQGCRHARIGITLCWISCTNQFFRPLPLGCN